MSVSNQSTNSNQPLTQQVYNAIFHNPHLNHRKMHVKADRGNIVLQGKVETYFEKQMAQEAVRKIDGIVSINNELEVGW